MTVNTPFPARPATPFWNPSGRFGMGDVVAMSTTAGTELDPVSGTGAQGTAAAPVGNPEYVCDDGSIPSSGLCANGNAATFYYIDPNGNWCTELVEGVCPAGEVVTEALATTTAVSSGTLLLIAAAIGAWMYFGGKL